MHLWGTSDVIFLLVWPVPLAQVCTHPQLIFFFQNLIFWNLVEFLAAKNHFKINISHILNPNLTK
jgi:hypothetical protein